MFGSFWHDSVLAPFLDCFIRAGIIVLILCSFKSFSIGSNTKLQIKQKLIFDILMSWYGRLCNVQSQKSQEKLPGFWASGLSGLGFGPQEPRKNQSGRRVLQAPSIRAILRIVLIEKLLKSSFSALLELNTKNFPSHQCSIQATIH